MLFQSKKQQQNKYSSYFNLNSLNQNSSLEHFYEANEKSTLNFRYLQKKHPESIVEFI